MADRRRRRRTNSEDDSEEISSESEHGNEDVRAEETTENKLSEKEDADKVVESEFHSAEEEENEVEAKEPLPEVQNETEAEVVVKGSDEDDVESPTELIDEDGGGEGIAEAEEVEGDFLDGDLLDASEEDEEEEEEGCVEEERQQGDGEECSPNSAVEKELDFDEDRRNPQYIPKKGTFYEHDDRNTESPKEKEVDTTRDKKKKKLWLDEGKWGHDRYREDEQIPKSRDELIEVYGYDIRCEDGPPRARRRRRYGRGPTKYERNWKDETAYGKEHTFGMYVRRGTRGGRSRGGRFRGSSFRGNARPYHKSENEESFKPEEQCIEDLKPIERKSTVIGSAKPNKEANLCGWESDGSAANEPAPVILSKRDFPALPAKEVIIRQSSPDRGSAFTRRKPSIPMNMPLETNSVRTQTFENSSFSNNKPTPSPPPPPPAPPSTYEKPPRRGGKSPVFRGTYRGAFKRMPRGRPVRGTDRYNNVNNSFIKPSVGPRLLDKQVNRINSELDRLNLNDRNESFEAPEIINTAHKQKKYNSHKVNGSKQSSSNIVPSSKNEDSSNRPKRYSSLRQRSLPETTNYQPTQASVPPPHPPFYDAAGFQAALYASEAVAQNSQPPSSGSPPVINPPQYQTFTATPYPESYSLRLPVNNTPRLFPQVTVPAGQQIMTPPPCITPNPSLLNYPPPPPAPPAYPPQFAYQQYPTPPPPPPPTVSQTPEMFRGGITYYYPQPQPPPVRQVPQKRPKAAIPIIPPPESEVKAVIEKKDLSQPEESQCSDADSIVDRTDSSTLQTQAPVEVES